MVAGLDHIFERFHYFVTFLISFFLEGAFGRRTYGRAGVQVLWTVMGSAECEFKTNCQPGHAQEIKLCIS